ncbi:unnamed protein product [Moneuplotes crassus]|uniref:RING-type E3 ubiquitin transferase n=1 Tax=Euplotes crassus TaxID=5936 RepID=A0AAD1UPF8_EUPCR|nr:unnamed protein product [Moneuplotes crassus]
MGKTDTPAEGKIEEGNPQNKSKSKLMTIVEQHLGDILTIPVEKQVKEGNNTMTDAEGTMYACNFDVSKNEEGKNTFNKYTKEDILHIRYRGLNLYTRVNWPRFKYTDKDKIKKTGVSKDAFNAFLEIVKCPVCLEVMDDPVNVKTCLHKFCNKCIEKYIRVKKKECPTCRTPIGSRRLLRKDKKLKEIIEGLIPDLEDFQNYEQEEVDRNVKKVKNSAKFKQDQQKLKAIKEKQLRAELEEKKEPKTPKLRTQNSRRAEPRTKTGARPASQMRDQGARQKKRMKTEHLEHELNISFKVKQLILDPHKTPRTAGSEEKLMQVMLLETNNGLCLKHLLQYIQMKSKNSNIARRTFSFFVRGATERNSFDKIKTLDVSLKKIHEKYWANTSKVQSIYFAIE